MPNSFYHKELTEAQWDRIKYLFKEPKKVGRPTLNPRMVLKGILCILRTGARWRDLPARYGNWNSIYHKFRQWCASGLFQFSWKRTCVIRFPLQSLHWFKLRFSARIK